MAPRGARVTRQPHRDTRAQRLALEQFHDHERGSLVAAEVVDGTDVGVVQRRGRAGFLLEPLDALGSDGGRGLGIEDLDRHPAVVLEVLGQVHRGHATPAELALDPVAIGQGILQALRQVGQGAASGRLRLLNLAQALSDGACLSGQGSHVHAGHPNGIWSPIRRAR